MSAYLQGADLAAFGVPNATAAQIQQASLLIDAYLGRPSGLIYVPDATGLPCYMAALTPQNAFTAAAAFGPGTVQVTVTGPTSVLQVGDCVVVDRANPTLTEAAQVTAINGQTLTIGSTSTPGLVNAHASGCVIETGLLITEKLYLPKERSEVLLANRPVTRVVGGTGRYAYGRRGDSQSYDMESFNLLAALNKFGGPPAWEIWPANTAASVDAATGQVWVPAGVMLAYYSEVQIRYVAGFTYANLPGAIKQACAAILTAQINVTQGGAWKQMKAGDTSMTRFADTVLDRDTKDALAPYKGRFFA